MSQYDIGLGIGAYSQRLRGARDKHNLYRVEYDDFDAPGLSASVFYRGASPKQLNFCAELFFLRRTFYVSQAYQGLAPGVKESLHVDLDLIYLIIVPEVRLDDFGKVIARFGPMIGFKVGGRVSGSRSAFNGTYVEETTYANSEPAMLQGDLRFMFGLSLRNFNAKAFGVSLDGYVNTALSSLLKDKPGSRGADVGITVGFYRRIQRKGLFVKAIAPSDE